MSSRLCRTSSTALAFGLGLSVAALTRGDAAGRSSARFAAHLLGTPEVIRRNGDAVRSVTAAGSVVQPRPLPRKARNARLRQYSHAAANGPAAKTPPANGTAKVAANHVRGIEACELGS